MLRCRPVAPGPQVGDRVGSYVLEEVLGVGGMGSVFLARHRRLSRRVAIKILAPHLAANPSYVSRFLTEARLISEISHPSIISILDLIESRDPPITAYVMEHVRGPTLRQELESAPFSVDQASGIGLQLTDALSAIHQAKVIHRDIKPANVLLSHPVIEGAATPRAKLLDFGIAKAEHGGLHRTTTGMIVGTPAYMAPEQVSGEEVSDATDVYALGEILYEMYSGKRVFAGSSRSVLRAKLALQAPRLEPIMVPDGDRLLSLIKRCLAPKPEARPSLSEIDSVLRSLRSGVTGPYADFIDDDVPTTANIRPPEASFSPPLVTMESESERALQTPQPTPALARHGFRPGMRPLMLFTAAILAACLTLLVVNILELRSSAVVATSVMLPPPTAATAPPEPAPKEVVKAPTAAAEAAGNWDTLPTRSLRSAHVDPEPEVKSPATAPTVAPKAPRVVDKPRVRPRSSRAKARASTAPKKTTLRTVPAGAVIVDASSGKRLGTSPLELELTRRSRRVRIEKKGYQTRTVFVGGGKKSQRFSLKKVKAAAEKEMMPW